MKNWGTLLLRGFKGFLLDFTQLQSRRRSHLNEFCLVLALLWLPKRQVHGFPETHSHWCTVIQQDAKTESGKSLQIWNFYSTSWRDWIANKRGCPCFVYSDCKKVLEMLKSRSHVFFFPPLGGAVHLCHCCCVEDQQILYCFHPSVHFHASCHGNSDGGACSVWFREVCFFSPSPLGWCWHWSLSWLQWAEGVRCGCLQGGAHQGD